MARYSDSVYRDTLTALMGDIYYAEDVSYDARIARMRKLGEIIVRRLIKLDTRSMLMLGDHRTIRALDERGMTEAFFRDALTTINKLGRNSTHSQKRVLPTREDFDTVSVALADVYAYLFFNYFKQFEFGSNSAITSAFSTLPPYVRFVVLKELVRSGNTSSITVEKLAKAAAKALGYDDASAWTEENRGWLSTAEVSYDRSMAIEALEGVIALGPEGATAIPLLLESMGSMSGSVYDYLKEELPKLRYIEMLPSAIRYATFEEAKETYLQMGIVDGDTEDVTEFNALMKFVYEGRRSEETIEFEAHVKDLMTSLKDLCAYCAGWKDDARIGADMSSALEIVKTEIDEVFSDLM